MTDVASIRDDMAVLTTIILRLDGSMSALIQETHQAWTDRAHEPSVAQAGGRLAAGELSFSLNASVQLPGQARFGLFELRTPRT